MTFRPSRRQVLSSLFVSAVSGVAGPLLTPQTLFAHPLSQAPMKTLQTSSFNPLTDIQPLSSTRQNMYPLILVHGISGFGRDELHGIFKYWGGFTDIQQDLNNHGFTTFTVGIGPFSSNWDRACELFAEIKGGRVDYGQAHSSKFGHARYGRTFPGLYPQWGQINPQTGKVNKIHLVGHSMGGQTSRLFAQLLEQGAAEEIAATPPDQLSPLFAGGGRSLIDSIFTISTPHNGSSAADLVQTVLPFSSQFIAFLAIATQDNQLLDYDFRLDQWGLVRQAGESIVSYTNRIEHSNINTTKDVAVWDAGPDGAGELNQIARAQSDIYYFSVASLQTHTDIFRHQVPDISMSPLFVPVALYMGSHNRNQPGRVVIDSSWWPNDEIVNTNSMPGPITGSTDVIIPYNGTPVLGQWNYMNIMDTFGHIDIIGWGLRDLRPWYRRVAAFLASLPQ